MIEISYKLKIVNFLDVILNLRNNCYKQFDKYNAIPTYINVNFNHPASTVKKIPDAINFRIYRLSSSKNIFNYNKDSYYEALYNSDYKNELEYLDDNNHHINRGNNSSNKGHNHRENDGSNNVNIDNKICKPFNKTLHRNIIWFNPPFCKL